MHQLTSHTETSDPTTLRRSARPRSISAPPDRRRSDLEPGGVTPSCTLAAREVAQLVRRIERALSIKSGDHRIESAQRHLRDEIAQSPRYLFGSRPWCRYRQWALVRFDRVVAHVMRTEAA